MKHLYDSESGKQAQLLSARARSKNAKKREQARELIKQHGVKELLEKYGVKVAQLTPQQKAEITMHVLTELITQEHLVKLKHSLKLDELEYKNSLETEQKLNDLEIKEQRKSGDSGISGLTISQAISTGLINKDSISPDDIDMVSLYV